MTNYRFPKRLRLLSAGDFERVFAARTSAGDGFVVMYGMPNSLEHPRLGLVVSRKVGPAVVRNRWKRVLREAFRLMQHELPPLDLVCIPRTAAEPDVAQLSQSFSALAARIVREFHRREERRTIEDAAKLADRRTSQ